jgi:hypothetical protein
MCDSCRWKKTNKYGMDAEWCEPIAEFLDYIDEDIKALCPYFHDVNQEKVDDETV